jgi:hypothetical protein
MESIVRFSGGLFTQTDTTTTPLTDCPDDVIASGSWSDQLQFDLPITTVAEVAVKATAVSLTSVTGSVDGALTVDDDYFLIANPASPSGYSMMVTTAGTNVTTAVQSITVDYNSVTPVSLSTLTCGASQATLTATAIQIQHTDDNSLTRTLTLYSADVNSGGFAFNFKGANEDGIEEMPLTYTAVLDTTRTSGDQLFAYAVQANAS